MTQAKWGASHVKIAKEFAEKQTKGELGKPISFKNADQFINWLDEQK